MGALTCRGGICFVMLQLLLGLGHLVLPVSSLRFQLLLPCHVIPAFFGLPIRLCFFDIERAVSIVSLSPAVENTLVWRTGVHVPLVFCLAHGPQLGASLRKRTIPKLQCHLDPPAQDNHSESLTVGVFSTCPTTQFQNESPFLVPSGYKTGFSFQLNLQQHAKVVATNCRSTDLVNHACPCRKLYHQYIVSTFVCWLVGKKVLSNFWISTNPVMSPTHQRSLHCVYVAQSAC